MCGRVFPVFLRVCFVQIHKLVHGPAQPALHALVMTRLLNVWLKKNNHFIHHFATQKREKQRRKIERENDVLVRITMTVTRIKKKKNTPQSSFTCPSCPVLLAASGVHHALVQTNVHVVFELFFQFATPFSCCCSFWSSSCHFQIDIHNYLLMIMSIVAYKWKLIST